MQAAELASRRSAVRTLKGADGGTDAIPNAAAPRPQKLETGFVAAPASKSAGTVRLASPTAKNGINRA